MTSRAAAWVAMARLPFHPMAFIAYGVGAAAAHDATGRFNLSVFLTGYLILVLIELATIFCNEVYDYETDRLNEHYSIFTGGSRVLVERRLGMAEVKRAIVVLLALCALITAVLVRIDGAASGTLIVGTLSVGVLLGMGYTAPPLRLCYRGLGELVVATTHSVYLIVCGYVLQTGILNDGGPWLLGIPLFFAVFAANTLAGIPDRVSDSIASKKSLAVLIGSRRATVVAAVAVVLAALAGVVLWRIGVLSGGPAAAMLIVVPHAALLLEQLSKLRKSGTFDRRIDTIIASALTYILWFGVIPLSSLLLR